MFHFKTNLETFIAVEKKKKKKKVAAKQETNDPQPTADSPGELPDLSLDGNSFKKEDIERLGKPLQGVPIEDKIVMEGKLKNPIKQSADDETVKPRDDL